ncbi:MAG: RsmD family RNA methyltransferase [Bacteroidales bacterium]|nr:RsmD family RNA methyltransferase [Bacteroidales bacterium]
MRIISGQYKGRHIRVHKNFSARPTTDFARENLFNFLNNYFDFKETIVLDLFSGTGSMSYEFASRGCPLTELVEINPRSCSFIKKTIHELQITTIIPHLADAYKYIIHCRNQYDLVFADPPYTDEKTGELPFLVMKHELLRTKGWFVLEHSGRYDFSGDMNFREKRKYGSVNFSVFCKPSD